MEFYTGYYLAHSVSQTVPEYIAKYHYASVWKESSFTPSD